MSNEIKQFNVAVAQEGMILKDRSGNENHGTICVGKYYDRKLSGQEIKALYDRSK